MDFDLSADQQRARDLARDLAEREIAPRAAEMDRAARFPEEIPAILASAGLLAPTAPPAEGGAGLDAVAFAVVVEELSRACAGAAALVRAHGALFVEPLLRFGSARQRQEILAPAGRATQLRGLGAFALDGAFTAERQPDGGYLVRGSDPHVLLGSEAEHVIVVAAAPAGDGAPRPAALIVRRGDGFKAEPAPPRFGLRAAPVAAIHLEGARVSPDQVLGAEGEGERVADAARELDRIGVAAQAVGVARAALDEAVAWAKAPRGPAAKPLSEGQAVQFLIADMAIEIDAARLLVLRAAALRDRGAPCAAEAAAARLHAAEVASRAAQRALQILGADGCAAGAGPDRRARDARILEIDGGTSEAQRMIIAGGMLRS